MIATDIVVVANRLPVTWKRHENGLREVSVAPGGLVSALTPVVEQLRCVWVGWDSGEPEESLRVNDMELVSVRADQDLYEQYYQGFANQILWPIFHGLSEYAADANSVAQVDGWWSAYREMNQIFASRVAEVAQPGALIWVQDYHLLLVPGLLKELRPDLRIAIFLHIPFPGPDQLQGWPWAAEMLRGLSEADLIGVQREQDAAHVRAAREVFAEECSPAIRAFPISIDVQPFLTDARAMLARQTPAKLREQRGIGTRPMLLSVDRLDYTKGILERVNAFSEVLSEWTDVDSRPVLVQVLTPTRQNVPAYRKYSERVGEAVSQVHERFATSDYVPIVTITEPLTAGELVEFYLAADVMCVTPLRDGMNLVAKEFVTSRVDEQGVLLLGREAGAADELVESLTVDPRDHEELVQALWQALKLTPGEAHVRMRALRPRVIARDVHRWAENFLTAANESNMAKAPGASGRHAVAEQA